MLSVFATVRGSRVLVNWSTRPKGSIVGAYQSGALSYFGSGHITAINLDGVVDPDAPSPDVPTHTLRYMERRNVRWLAEWDFIMRKLLNVSRRRA